MTGDPPSLVGPAQPTSITLSPPAPSVLVGAVGVPNGVPALRGEGSLSCVDIDVEASTAVVATTSTYSTVPFVSPTMEQVRTAAEFVVQVPRSAPPSAAEYARAAYPVGVTPVPAAAQVQSTVSASLRAVSVGAVGAAGRASILTRAAAALEETSLAVTSIQASLTRETWSPSALSHDVVTVEQESHVADPLAVV